VPKARPGATCSDEPAKPIRRQVPGSAYYAYKPGLGQGELKLWIGLSGIDTLEIEGFNTTNPINTINTISFYVSGNNLAASSISAGENIKRDFSSPVLAEP